MNRYQDRIMAMDRIVTAVAVLLFLVSCAPAYSASKHGESRIAKVGEGIYRGPRPDDLSELQPLKIRTILNLEDNTEAVQEENKTAKRLGMTMINIPMSEIFRPRATDLLQAVKILEDGRSHPVYVHCLHGRDRTGFVIAAYRIIDQGWNAEKAYREAVDSGHNRWFYDFILGWKKSLLLIADGKTGTAGHSMVAGDAGVLLP